MGIMNNMEEQTITDPEGFPQEQLTLEQFVKNRIEKLSEDWIDGIEDAIYPESELSTHSAEMIHEKVLEAIGEYLQPEGAV